MHNHFYRRLQRHAQISILMRAGRAQPAPQDGEESILPEGPATAPLPLVQATLAPAAGPPAPPESGNPTGPSAKAPEAAAGPAAVATSDAAAPAPAVDEAAADDPGWQRLQAIKRKHDARPKPEGGAPAPPAPSRAARTLQRKPAAPPHNPRGAQQGRGTGAVESSPAADEADPNVAPKAPIAIAPEQDQKTPRPPAPSPASPQEAVRAPQSDDVARRDEHAVRDAVEDNSPDPGVPHEPQRGDRRESAPGQRAATAGNLVQRAPTESSSADTMISESTPTLPTERSGTAVDEVPATDDSGGSAAQQNRPAVQDTEDSAAPGDAEDGGRPAARVPVQVQRAPQRDELHDSAATDAPPAQDRPSTPAREAPVQDKSNEETRPLQAVWPVQRKESGATTEREPASDPPSEEPPVAGSAQKSLPHDDVASLQKVRSALQTMSSRPTASSVELVLPRRPRPAAQRKPAQQDDTRKEAPEGKKETVVQTDIGPLPADLWQLLDDGRSPAPPSDEPGQQDTTPLLRQSPDPAPLQRAPEADPPVPSPSLAQSAITRVTQAVANETEVESDDETDHEEPAAIDIDALARRVLPHLRRRLAVEWERGRGRI